jgi:hypothetical protein
MGNSTKDPKYERNQSDLYKLELVGLTPASER